MGIRSGAAALALALAAGVAGTSGAQEIVNPTWAAMPDGEAMAEAYPMFASMADLGGDVTLSCRVALDGQLSLCRVVEAVPAGVGFDRAALSLASRFRANPRQVDGEATKSSIQFTVRFRLEDDPVPPPWRGAEPSPEHVAAVDAYLREMETSMGPEEDIETLDLEVDADREARLRAMIRRVDAETEDLERETGALTLARLITPEQLADLQAGRGWPPRPTDAMLESAGDAAARASVKWTRRLNQLYCAEFDCPALIVMPPPAE